MCHIVGIAASGAGIGGGISSLVIRGLMPRIGYNRTLLVYACLNLAISVGAWFLLEVRELPSARGQPRVTKTWLPVGVWRDPTFYSCVRNRILSDSGPLLIHTFSVLWPVSFSERSAS